MTAKNAMTALKNIFIGSGIGSYLKIDPRLYQLIVQVSLLSWGIFYLQFDIPLSHITATIFVALLLQKALTSSMHLPANFLSALNSSLSLLLLLRVDAIYWLVIAITLAIGSKFFITYRKQHRFNPSAFAIVVLLLVTDSAWISSGQWGQAFWLTLLAAGVGLAVLLGIKQILTSLAFLSVYSSAVILYALWLGDPMTVPLHKLQNGALLIFTFFMISDPKTTPTAVAGRIIYGSLVAIAGFLIERLLFLPNAFLYALVFATPSVILLNRQFQAVDYHWPLSRSSLCNTSSR